MQFQYENNASGTISIVSGFLAIDLGILWPKALFLWKIWTLI